MNILGIETSCDETAAAVVRDGRDILSNVVVSSLKEHRQYGGIIPEIASRRQLEAISPVVEEALERARLDKKAIGAVAVTQSPGLIGSLLVGLSYARALAFALKKPLIEVDHVKAHLYAAFLASAGQRSRETPPLPAVGLIVSGGHTSLYLIRSWRDFRLVGKTRDDAAGEAFDKVARILGLGYPGGPVIDRLAAGGQGIPGNVPLRCADLPDSYDFSFSGIKTAVLYYANKNRPAAGPETRAVAAAFQQKVVSVLVKKSLAACRDFRVSTLVLGGGVAANTGLRQELTRAAAAQSVNVFFPPLDLCMDNAAMVAGFSFYFKNNK